MVILCVPVPRMFLFLAITFTCITAAFSNEWSYSYTPNGWKMVPSKSKGWSDPDPGPVEESRKIEAPLTTPQLILPENRRNDRVLKVSHYSNDIRGSSDKTDKANAVEGLDYRIYFLSTTEDVRNVESSLIVENNYTSSSLDEHSPLSSRSKDLGIDLISSPGSESRKKKKGKMKMKKKYQQFMVPLLLAYKLKFFALIPVLIGGLVLLAGSTGLAGFFFALFAAVMGLKGWN